MPILTIASSGNPDALTTALIALGGAIIGGVLTSATQLRIERQRVRGLTDERRRQAKIAARMMAVDFARAESNLGYTVEYNEWWRTPGLSPRLSEADRRLVLGELSPEGFYVVDRAEAAVDHWYGIRDRAVSETGFGITPGTIDFAKLKEIMGWLRATQAPLSKLTGDPARVEAEAIDRLGP